MPYEVEGGGTAVVEGGAIWGGVTGGVTHAMSGGGGEVQQWWRVGIMQSLGQKLTNFSWL